MTKSKNPEENTMIRKSILALTGIAALGAAALAPTSASAWGKGGWGHHGFGGFGFYGSGYGVSYVDVVPSCYYVKKINRFGEVRLIKVCEYSDRTATILIHPGLAGGRGVSYAHCNA